MMAPGVQIKRMRAAERDGGVLARIPIPTPTLALALTLTPTPTLPQINACALLKEMAEYQPALQRIEDGHGRDLLLSAINNHQFNEDLLGRASEALRYLPEAIHIDDDGA